MSRHLNSPRVGAPFIPDVHQQERKSTCIIHKPFYPSHIGVKKSYSNIQYRDSKLTSNFLNFYFYLFIWMALSAEHKNTLLIWSLAAIWWNETSIAQGKSIQTLIEWSIKPTLDARIQMSPFLYFFSQKH